MTTFKARHRTGTREGAGQMNQEQVETAARALFEEKPVWHFRDERPALWDEVTEPAKDRYRHYARAVIAAIHPTVETVDELDALPDGAAVLDSEHDVAQKYEDKWYFLGGQPLSSSTLASFGNLTLLYDGGTR